MTSVPAAVPFYSPEELDQRSQRPGLLRGRVSPVLPAQSERHRLGQHDLGPCREPRSVALEATGQRHRARQAGHDLLRLGRGGRDNTAGFQTGAEKTIVCIYTSAGSRSPRASPIATTAAAPGPSTRKTPCCAHCRRQSRSQGLLARGHQEVGDGPVPRRQRATPSSARRT